jgi:hypothetical protein
LEQGPPSEFQLCKSLTQTIIQKETKMNNLPRIIYLSTTDAEFRAALQIDPRAALAERGLEANDDELAALTELCALIAIAPQKLFALLAKGSTEGYWGVAPPVPEPSTN